MCYHRKVIKFVSFNHHTVGIMETDRNLLNDFAREQWEKAQAHLSSNYSLTPGECSEVFARAMVALYDTIRWGGMRSQGASLSSKLADIVDNKAREYLKMMRRDVPASVSENASLSNASGNEHDAEIIKLMSSCGSDGIRALAMEVAGVDMAPQVAAARPGTLPLPPPTTPQMPRYMAQQRASQPVAKKRRNLVPIMVAVAVSVLLCVVAIAFFTMLKREIQVREREIEEQMAQSEDDYSESTYDWETDSINVAISNELDTLLAEVEAGKNLKPNIAKLDSLWEESNANRNSDYAYFTPEIGYILACAYKQDNDIKKAKTTARMVMSIEPQGTEWGDKVRKLLEELKKMKE